MESEIASRIDQQNEVLSTFIKPKLGEAVLTKSSEFFVLDSSHQTQFCRMTIYSQGVLPGPFDETVVTKLLFPLPDEDESDKTLFGDSNHQVFASVLEWDSPSMAIEIDTEMYPLKWLSRIEHYDPFCAYDFTIYAVLL